MRGVIFAVVRDAGYIEAFDEAKAVFAVAIDNIIYGAAVVLFENGNVDQLRLAVLFLAFFRAPDEDFVGYTHDLVSAVAIEKDYVVDVGTVVYKFVFLERSAHKAIGAVDVEFLIGLDHLRCDNRIERAQFGAARMLGRVFVEKQLKPIDRHAGHIVQILVDARHIGRHTGNEFVGLFFVEFQDARHFDFEQAQNVFLGDLAIKLRVIRRQTLVNMDAGSISRDGLLKGLIFVDALFDEDALQ